MLKNFKRKTEKSAPENRKTDESQAKTAAYMDSTSESEIPGSVFEIHRRSKSTELNERFDIGLEETSDISCEVGTDKWFHKLADIELDGCFDGIFNGDYSDCDCD